MDSSVKALLKKIWCVFGAGVVGGFSLPVAVWIWSHRGDPKLINYAVDCIPVALTVLIAFIPDLRRAPMRWRIAIVSIGLIWSILLWRKEVLTVNDQRNALTEAVKEANEHSDKVIGAVRSDVQAIKTDVQGVKNDLEIQFNKTISKSTTTLSETIGKVNKPTPPESARLQFSFFVEGTPDSDLPILSRFIREDKDGNVPIDVCFLNISGTTAETVDVWIYVCDSCSFAAEPSGFDRPQGLNEHARHRMIALLNPGTQFEKTTIIVKPPQPTPVSLEIGFRYSCKVCGKPAGYQKLAVFVQPPA